MSTIFAGDWPVSTARSRINRLRRGSLIIIHCSINWDLCLLWKLLTCKEAKSGQTSSQVCLQHVTPARILTAKNWINTPLHNLSIFPTLTNIVEMNQQIAQEGLHVISGSMQPTECCCFVLLCNNLERVFVLNPGICLSSLPCPASLRGLGAHNLSTFFS